MNLATLLEWVSNPLVLSAIGGAVVLLLVISLAAGGRKKPRATKHESAIPVPRETRPQPAREPKQQATIAATPAQAVLLAPALTGASLLRDWRRVDGGEPLGVVEAGWLRLVAHQGLRTAATCKSVPGKKYTVEFSARAGLDATNGAPNNFFVGPMFLDVEGKVVCWWKEEAPIECAEGTRAGSATFAAPSNAATVHISVRGSYAKEGPAGNGAVDFTNLRLIECG